MSFKTSLSLVLAVIVATFVLVHTSIEHANAQSNEIVIQNFAFEPATLTVKPGTKVTWVNRDDEPHTATANDKSFNSKTLDTGDRFSMEFSKPGTYSYYCALHPKMTGRVIVK
jgi:plastocyanin